MWYLGEIAAEDYVVLMGSENTKNVINFFDHKVMWANYKKNNMSFIYKYGYRIRDCSNGIPHENAQLELPLYVEGLDDYFYSFVDDESPFLDSYDEIGSLNLAVEYLDYNQYKFTWDRPYKEHDVTYTLIGYDADDGSIKTIVRTISGNQTSDAWFGNFTSIQLNFCDNETIDYFQDIHLLWNCKKGGQMTFRVSVAFPDGIVLLSDPLTVTWE